MELNKAREIAEAKLIILSPACTRIEVAGSIRRRKPDVGDIEFLCIPKFDGITDLLDQQLQWLIQSRILEYRRNKRGAITYGPLNKLLWDSENGIGIDVFSTTEECWHVSMVVRTGGKATNVRISMAAIQKGYQFHAYGSGFSTPHGDIVCRSEREVFEAVGLPYLEPWKRD